MKRPVIFLVVVAMVVAACNKAKPTMIGRFNGPTDLAEYKGCQQKSPSCDTSTQAHHLLLIANSLDNDLRVFDVENRNFFVAKDPLFTLSVPVGELPVSLAVDPLNNFAFVVNAISQDVSLVDLRSNLLVEVDANTDSTKCNVEVNPVGNHCRAALAAEADTQSKYMQPQYIVVPRQMIGATDTSWDTHTPLPVYVSLLMTSQSGGSTGQVTALNFTYPDSNAGTPQLREVGTPWSVGVTPSGMALTKDGSTLFVADEGSDSIHVITTSNTNTDSIKDINIGGPSRRLALTPDEQTLYVIHSTTPDISVVHVDVDNNIYTLCQPCSASCTQIDPGAPNSTIALQNMPRSLTFVKGLTLSVNGKTFAPQGSDVQTFAYVSNLDGGVYVVDAENHCAINSSTVAGEFSFEIFIPTVLTGMAGAMISDNFSSDPKTNDFRIFLLFEGSDAMMEFFPSQLDSTNYILYQ